MLEKHAMLNRGSSKLASTRREICTRMWNRMYAKLQFGL